MIFVYPYNQELDQGNELRYALRALDKYCTDPVDVVVLSPHEKPDWYIGDFMRVGNGKYTREAYTGRACAFFCRSFHHSKNSDEFVWMNDDILPIKTFSIKTIEQPHMLEDLTGVKMPDRLRDPHCPWTWGRKLWNTISHCAELGLDLINYEAHMPYLFDRWHMLDTMDVFAIEHGRELMATAYYNYTGATPVGKARNIRAGFYGKSGKIKEDHVFLNYEAGNYKNVIGIIKEMFPNPSKFERQ